MDRQMDRQMEGQTDGRTEKSTSNNTYFISFMLTPITVVIGKIIHGVIVLEMSCYSGSRW